MGRLFITNHVLQLTLQEKSSCNNMASSLQDMVKLNVKSEYQPSSLTQSVYRKTSNIRCTKSLNLNVSHLVLQLSAQSIEASC